MHSPGEQRSRSALTTPSTRSSLWSPDHTTQTAPCQHKNYTQPHWSKNLSLRHAASYAIEWPPLRLGFTRQLVTGEMTSSHMQHLVKKKLWGPPWKLLVCNVINLLDHNDLKSKVIKKAGKETYYSGTVSPLHLASELPKTSLKYSPDLKFPCCRRAPLPPKPSLRLAEIPRWQGLQPWLFWEADTFTYCAKENDKPGTTFTLVKCNQLHQHRFWLSLQPTKVSGPCPKPHCSDAQDIHYPPSKVLPKHHFIIALWIYSIITENSFQLKETTRGSEILYIIQ